MKLIWTVVALAAVAAMYLIYRDNHPAEASIDPYYGPTTITGKCDDSYPAVLTEVQAPDGQTKIKVSCNTDRFIKKDVPERTL